MENKIQLQHPAGKKAVKMDSSKYDVLKAALTDLLRANGELTHTELSSAIVEKFNKDNIAFEGSVPWNLEWVKLDLETKKILKRTGKSPVKFSLAG